MSVNQDDSTLVERKRQIPELPKEYGFLDEKVQTLKSSRSNYIVEITCNINKISKYLNSKSVERDKIYLCIEKLDKCIQKIKAVSYEVQSYVFEETTKKEISDIYIDQRLQIIEIKKYIEVHSPIPYLTKTAKKRCFFHKCFLRKQRFKIKLLKQFWKFHPFEDKIFHKRL